MAVAEREKPPEPRRGKGKSRSQKTDMLAMYAKLDALGQALAKKRSEAINGRQSSGIEDIWLEDEEYYEGIDEKNRASEGRGTWRQKPPGQVSSRQRDSTQSTVFPNITGPFTDAAAARIADMLLPTDDKGWGLRPTPVPELEKMADGIVPPALAQAPSPPQPSPGMPTAGAPSAGALAPAGAPGGTAMPGASAPMPGAMQGPPEAANAAPPGAQEAPTLSPEQERVLAVKQAAEEEMSEARRRCRLAERRIEDWLVECQYNAEMRKVIEDSARIGTGIMKGPVPFTKKSVRYQDGGVAIKSEIIPRSKWIDPWNFYPDPACGENIHNGSYTWERDFLTTRQLMELMEDKYYLPDQIKLCLEEGPIRATAEYREKPDVSTKTETNGKYEIWYYYGLIEKSDLEAAGCDCEGMEDGRKFPACISLVNNHVIKASLNHLDTGEYPYDVMVWRRRAGHWTGIGVARQIRTPQKMIVGATRHLMDNAGIAAGPMLVFRHGAVYPADGRMGLAPRKILYVAEDAETIDDVRKAVGTIKVDMVIEELLRLIELGMKFAEDTTGLPMLLQGQMGAAPDTVGGMTMLNNNATAVLRRLARTFDDRITEPHIRRYYTWLLQYSENDDEKGDYNIEARGSSALVERDIQAQEIMQMAQIVTDIRFGADPKKWFTEYLKSRRFDPDQFQFDDQEWKQTVEKLSAPPPDSSVEVANINAASRQAVAEINAGVKQFVEEARAEIRGAELQHESQENELDRQLNMMIAQFEAEMEGAFKSMQESGLDRRTLDTLKQKTADTFLKLKTQKELSASEALRPAAEPKGRAPDGQSFQK